MLYKVIKEITLYQSTPYKLRVVEEIRNYLFNLSGMTEQVMITATIQVILNRKLGKGHLKLNLEKIRDEIKLKHVVVLLYHIAQLLFLCVISSHWE